MQYLICSGQWSPIRSRCRKSSRELGLARARPWGLLSWKILTQSSNKREGLCELKWFFKPKSEAKPERLKSKRTSKEAGPAASCDLYGRQSVHSCSIINAFHMLRQLLRCHPSFLNQVNSTFHLNAGCRRFQKYAASSKVPPHFQKTSLRQS